MFVRAGHSHDALGIPEDGVGVEIGGWVEPQVELLLSVSLALAEHVGVENVGVPAQISQEFEVYLVVG